jgi:hypothetical protein
MNLCAILLLLSLIAILVLSFLLYTHFNKEEVECNCGVPLMGELTGSAKSPEGENKED